MKSSEEVIKYKLNFLPKETEPFYAIQRYTAGRASNLGAESVYKLYEVKERIFSNDPFSLMEDITPLFIYISSCDKYYRENGHGEICEIVMFLIMVDGPILRFSASSTFNDIIDEHRISKFKKNKNDSIQSLGYYERYTKPFKIWFNGSFRYFRTEEDELQRHAEELQRRAEELQYEAEAREAEAREAEEAYYRREAYYEEQGYYAPGGAFIGENDNDESEDEFPINDSKTFKSDQCVICLEKEPKVLFCNCGHICICEKCTSRRYDNCLLCKKENTILRIIE